MPSKPSKNLESFDNPQTDIDYTIRIDIPEFTCLCPLTGQPDFATIHIAYVPDQKCIELKALKMFMWSFREEGAFHEKVTNDMLAAFVAACEPRFMRVTGLTYAVEFTPLSLQNTRKKAGFHRFQYSFLNS